jgi:hypothetical protein
MPLLSSSRMAAFKHMLNCTARCNLFTCITSAVHLLLYCCRLDAHQPAKWRRDDSCSRSSSWQGEPHNTARSMCCHCHSWALVVICYSYHLRQLAVTYHRPVATAAPHTQFNFPRLQP